MREATATSFYPDPLDVTHPISFLHSPHSPSLLQLRLRQYRSSVHQKCVLALVSQTWNTLAQEVLFEFVWISRASQARTLALTLLSQECDSRTVKGGPFIRRLHIETPMLERCDPADLRTILDYAPRLVVYSDYRSVRRNLYEEFSNPRSSPEQLFSVLAHPNNSLRRLSWTNYDVSFYLHTSPMLETTAMNLEYLELNFCSPHLHSMTRSMAPVTSSTFTLTLPALRSLKVTLDNATFAVLSTWSMPVLQNLSVLSADFSYAGCGFSQFFIIHGPKLTQLELGHSSSTIEEHYLTIPPYHNSPSPRTIPLDTWCPNLQEFICSADAEWNWQNPDWIAPHILLPSHPALKFIGIRDIDKRLLDDIALAPNTALDDDTPFFMLLEQMGSILRREAFPSLLYIRDMSWESDVMRRSGDPSEPGTRIVKFWKKVLERCRSRGVWLEDYRGFNITSRDLKKVEARIWRRSISTSET
ncbi:hypothetical protein BDN72DRAFT_9578 [Pluteus cervinus]|uniref:Uncharacterized protein n=1 Tax=Pluteus cervinus TaxID=181527 RepID=A0ACD3BF98_9AGAR|nr:hypothetical protein BDN72DRAFT_9578 [Pluteus cervinus]